MSNVTPITQKFDRDVDTVLTWFHVQDTQPLAPVPWSTLMYGPASDPEITVPDPPRRRQRRIPVWLRLVGLTSICSTAYLLGIVQGVLMTRGY